MNDKGEIREYTTLLDNEIDITKDIEDVEKLSTKGRKEYYKAIKQKLSHEAAMACANYVERVRRAR